MKTADRKPKRLFKPADVRAYARGLGLRVSVKDYEKHGSQVLHCAVYVPEGVKLRGIITDAVNFEISCRKEGDAEWQAHILCEQLALYLTRLKPQIDAGEIW